MLFQIIRFAPVSFPSTHMCLVRIFRILQIPRTTALLIVSSNVVMFVRQRLGMRRVFE